MYYPELATAIAQNTEALPFVADVPVAISILSVSLHPQAAVWILVGDVPDEASSRCKILSDGPRKRKAEAPALCEEQTGVRYRHDPQESSLLARQRVQRPTAMLIVAHGSMLLRQRRKLAEVGFKVTTAYSLLDGYAEALQRFAVPRRRSPSLILLDVQGAEPGFPEFPGSLLAAVFARHMCLHEIPAAWLVGLTTETETEHEHEALVAGCHHVVHAPLSEESLRMLYGLVQGPAPMPYGDTCAEHARVIDVLQNVAARVLQVVRSAHIDMWTAEDIALVLGWLTRFPTANQKAVRQATIASVANSEHIKHLLRALGGPRAARGRLETIAEEWQARYPLHSEVLSLFLEGWERREIVRHFVAQGLYEDTRVYNCIKELPQRISEQFRIDQIGF